MFRCNAKSDRLRRKPWDQSFEASFRLSAVVSAMSIMALATMTQGAPAKAEEPFKFANIHFETNASACDMGIQILFDTDGITEGSIEDPNEKVVFSLEAVAGKEETHDLTELFQERVEPPIVELEKALGCESSPDAILLSDLFKAWPAGRYEFEGLSGGVEFEGSAVLTRKVPAGPVITAPDDGDVVPHDNPLVIRWNKVTGPILPNLGPVQIVGYHIVVKDLGVPALPGAVPPQLDGDVSKNETSFTVPKQYLEPGRKYEFEVLATERGNNQTITEGGVFCTPPITPANCELPQ